MKTLGDQRFIASTLGHLGRLSEYEGNMSEAERLYFQALNIFEKLGSPDAEKARADLQRLRGESS